MACRAGQATFTDFYAFYDSPSTTPHWGGPARCFYDDGGRLTGLLRMRAADRRKVMLVRPACKAKSELEVFYVLLGRQKNQKRLPQ